MKNKLCKVLLTTLSLAFAHYANAESNYSYSLAVNTDTDTAAIGSTYKVNVGLDEEMLNLKLGSSVDNQTQTANIHLQFKNQKYSQYFNVSYQNCNNVTTTNSECQISITPKKNAKAIAGQSINYTITTTVNGQLLQSNNLFTVDPSSQKLQIAIGLLDTQYIKYCTISTKPCPTRKQLIKNLQIAIGFLNMQYVKYCTTSTKPCPTKKQLIKKLAQKLYGFNFSHQDKQINEKINALISQSNIESKNMPSITKVKQTNKAEIKQWYTNLSSKQKEYVNAFISYSSLCIGTYLINHPEAVHT
ncbi:hypothetical protein L3V83_14060 [Thiotrichales bacterium 19X7-9]|nr:hypothetical protein [Thiotrichales bacterium 19X7-9]